MNQPASHADDFELAEFQGRLLDLLDTAPSPQEALTQLQAESLPPELAAYVDQFDLRMVEVAMQLVKRWGVRSS